MGICGPLLHLQLLGAVGTLLVGSVLNTAMTQYFIYGFLIGMLVYWLLSMLPPCTQCHLCHYRPKGSPTPATFSRGWPASAPSTSSAGFNRSTPATCGTLHGPCAKLWFTCQS